MSSTGPTATPRTMTFDSQLIEDFLHTDDILVDTTSDAPLALFLNSAGDCEALVLSKNSSGNDELYHVCREPLSDSGWNVYGLGAYAAGLAAVDSDTAWAVGTDRQIWQNRNGRWSQRWTLPGGATPMGPSKYLKSYVPVSVGPDGAVWAIDGGGNLYQYDAGSNTWQPEAGVQSLGQAPAGSSEDLWAVQAFYLGEQPVGLGDEPNGYQVVRRTGGAWQQIQWAADSIPQQIAVGADGSVWAIDDQGGLYQYVNQQWQQVQTPTLKLTAIAVASAGGIWGVNNNGQATVVRYEGGTWQTAGPPGGGGTGAPGANLLPQISVADDCAVWYTDGDGVTWKRPAGGGSSWQRLMMPPGMSGATAQAGVTEVAVGRDDDDGPQAFYVSDDVLFHSSLTAAGTWSHVSLLYIGGLCGIGVTNQQGTGELIAYGVSGGGDLIVVTRNSSTRQYAFRTIPASGELKDARIYVNVNSEGAWFTAAMTKGGGTLMVQWGDADNPLGGGNPWPQNQMLSVTQAWGGRPAPQNLAGLVRVPWVEAKFQNGDEIGFYMGVVDSDGVAYMVFNLQYFEGNGVGSFIPMTGKNSNITPAPAAAKSTGAVLDSRGMLRIYVADANEQLWVLRQTGVGSGYNDQGYPLQWSAWHPLGDDCTYLANGPGAHATHELFTLDADNLLKRLWQDPVSSNWHSAHIRKPTGADEEPYYVSQYVTEVTVLDADGNPEPNVQLTVSVNEPVSVWLDCVQYSLDAAHPATFTTNQMGKVALNTLALGLHTAQLNFQAGGFASAYAVYPPQNVQERLAAVDGPTLQNAQARTQSVPKPESEALVSTQSGQSNCGGAAGVIQGVFKVKSNNNIDPGGPTGVTPGTYTPPSCEAVRALWASKVVGVRTVATAGGAAGDWDWFWTELAQFGEDIWHGIHKGILALENIVVDIEKGLVEVTLTLTEVGSAVISFLVKTIDDVVNAVGAAFRWVGAEVEKAIDWLKAFFSWDDILNTKRVIEYYVNQVLGNIVNNLDPSSPQYVVPLVQAQFQKFVDLIAGGGGQPDAFSRAQTTFGANTFTGSVGHVPVDPNVGSNALQPDKTQNTYSAHQVRCNYAHRKTETYVRQGGSVVPVGGGAAALATDGTPFDGFLDFVHQTLNSSSKYTQAQASFTANLQQMKNAKGLFDTAVNDFLALVKEIVIAVIELVEDIVVELLKLAGGALADFQKMLDHELHIPVISWLYREISGHPLTLLDLFCLVIAIPSTIIYKLIWGGSSAAPPFTKEQADQITGQKNIPWPQVQGTTLGAALPSGPAAGAPGDSPESIIFGILALLNSLPYALVDLATDIEATYPEAESSGNFTKWLSGLSILLSVAGFAWAGPYEMLQEKSPDQRTAADNAYITLWALGGLPILLNIGSAVGGASTRLAKYMPLVGPLVVSVFGAVQLGFGVASAIEFSKPGSGYNAAYSAGAIVTPIPSVCKILLAFQQPTLTALVLGPLDLICDVGSGCCSFAEGVS